MSITQLHLLKIIFSRPAPRRNQIIIRPSFPSLKNPKHAAVSGLVARCERSWPNSVMVFIVQPLERVNDDKIKQHTFRWPSSLVVCPDQLIFFRRQTQTVLSNITDRGQIAGRYIIHDAPYTLRHIARTVFLAVR